MSIILKRSLLAALLSASWTGPAALAGVEVIYLDGETRSSADIRNLEVVEDVFKQREAEYQRRIAAIEADRAEKAKRLEELAERLAALETEKQETASQRDQLVQQERERQAARQRREELDRNKNYELVVDHTKRVVSHIGQMPSVLPAVTSEGENVELRYAFSSLIPMDWQLYLSRDVEPDARVTWSATGENWIKGLYDLGVDYGLQFNVNWTDRWVLVNESDEGFGARDIPEPSIRIDGLNIDPGKRGHILIDNRLLEIESVR